MSATALISAIFEVLAPLAALGYASVLALLIHEAGHALAGWSVGWVPRRVVIGLKGRYLASLRFGPVPLVFCGWPNGGLNRFGPDAGLSGRKGLWVLLGGPLAGVLASAAAWALDRQLGMRDFFLIQPHTPHFWLAFFMMGNLCCALRSLLPVPLMFHSGSALFSDGWRITGMLAERKSLSPEKTARLRKRLAWGVALFCTALVIVLFTVDYEERFQQRRRDLDKFGLPRHPELHYPTLSTAILLIPPIFLMTYSWKVAKSPMPREDSGVIPCGPEYGKAYQACLRLDFSTCLRLIAERSEFPESDRPWRMLEVEVLNLCGNFAALESLTRELAAKEAEADEEDTAWKTWLMGRRIPALSGLGRENEADDLLETLRVNLEGEEWQVLLDTVATRALHNGDPSLCRLCLPHLRRACGQPEAPTTLWGTYGSVLAELRMWKEAGPILHRVLKTTESLDDVGIVSVFLAEAAAADGRLPEARGHAVRAVRVCDLPWVYERAARIPGAPALPPALSYAEWRSDVSPGTGGRGEESGQEMPRSGGFS